jgi:hypothetical protein
MSDYYAMRRANGDWFALEDHGHMRVPLFHSSHDALMARLRNVGMLLFHPVALDARMLNEIENVGESDVDLCLVKDPFASLKHSPPMKHSELALLMNTPPEGRSALDGNGVHASPESEWWN